MASSHFFLSFRNWLMRETMTKTFKTATPDIAMNPTAAEPHVACSVCPAPCVSRMISR